MPVGLGFTAVGRKALRLAGLVEQIIVQGRRSAEGLKAHTIPRKMGI